MSPTATRPAARRASNGAQGRIPRRVSGPAGGRNAVTPSHAPPRVRFTRRTKRRPGTLVLRRTLLLVRALPDHQLLDRVVRGRTWIPLLGVLLAGIVAMQVEVLKLGASIGRSLETGSALESRNELLRANVAELADDQRIERLAAAQGMVMPAPTQVAFLPLTRGGDVGRAISNIHRPNATSFLALISANGAVVTGADQGATATGAASVPAAGGTAVGQGQTLQSQTGVATQSQTGVSTAPQGVQSQTGISTAPQGVQSQPVAGPAAVSVGASPSGTSSGG